MHAALEPANAVDPRLLRLDPRDNVLTVIAPIEAGETVRLPRRLLVVKARLPLGHKVADRDIAPGEKILKYGVPIGSATVAIMEGDHVHTHNLRSDYLPTYLHETQGHYFKDRRA